MISFILNNEKVDTILPSGSLLLDFIRCQKLLTGTKIGCREGDCGACTVLIGELIKDQIIYHQVVSCLTPIGNVNGKHVVSIEGLNMNKLSPVQQHLIDESATQCGFCTVGFVVSLSNFCLANTSAIYEDAIAAISGNICRCTGYKSIERAARKITSELLEKNINHPIDWLVTNNIIPSYFKTIPQRLASLPKLPPTKKNEIFIGGGTDLYVQKHDELIEIYASHIPSLPNMKFIKPGNDLIRIGGGTTVTEFLESEVIQQHFPGLRGHLKLVSSQSIRNMSTISGNFVNASPIGDLSIFFLALNAFISLKNGNDTERIIPLKQFYKGYKDLDLREGELISFIAFRKPYSSSSFNLEKVSKRIHLDIATVNSAILITTSNNIIDEIHISAGGVAPIPLYLEKTRTYLIGKRISTKNIQMANEILQTEISPIPDIRGSKIYKQLLLRQLFYAHFIKLFPNQISLKDLNEKH